MASSNGLSVSTPSSLAQQGMGHQEALLWVRVGLAALIAGQLMAFSLAVNLSPVEPSAYAILHGFLAGATVLVFLLVGGPLVAEAMQQWRERRVGVEQFFLIGMVGAFAASVHASVTRTGAVFYEVVAILLAIYTFGTILAKRRRDAARKTGEWLRTELAMCARVLPDGRIQRVAASAVQAGDVVEVMAGESVPVDGTLAEGMALVEESLLNGEPFPVVKRVGDGIWAGSRPVDATIRVTASQAGGGRKVDGLISALQEAQAKTSPMQTEADRLVRWFLPVVLGLAGLTFAIWTWKSGWVVGTFNALAVLVVACPCAMGLATPIGIWGALDRLARLGIIPRRAGLIDGLARVDTVIFDKTGTLSEETLAVVDFETGPGVDRSWLRSLVATVQRQSPHPVARAFGAWAESVRTDWQVEPPHMLAGVGLSAVVRTCCGTRHTVRLGNDQLLAGNRPGWAELRGDRETSLREVWIEVDGQVLGVARLKENLRASASLCLEALRRLGLRTEVMTGDREEGALALGLTGAQAGLLPHEKVERIRALQAAGHQICFIGDGANDAGALEEADVGLALANGAALAKQTAAGEIYGTNLAALPEALVVCRRVVSSIRQNLYFAIFYNCLGMGLAAAGIIHPVLAAVLMLVSSSAVTWRALRAVDGLKQVGERLSMPPRESWLEGQLQAFVQWFRKPAERWSVWTQSRPMWPLVVGAALAMQGPLLGWMGSVGFGVGLGLVVISVLLGALAAYHFESWKGIPTVTFLLGMVALGNVGMLAGWVVEAGFGPVVREGICLCGCPKSPMGWGLVGFGPMQAGMLLASLPALLIPSAGVPAWCKGSQGRFWLHGLLCLLGMIVGMELVGVVLAGLPMLPPRIHFAVTAGAMMVGMVLGMVVACRVFRAWGMKRV